MVSLMRKARKNIQISVNKAKAAINRCGIGTVLLHAGLRRRERNRLEVLRVRVEVFLLSS